MPTKFLDVDARGTIDRHPKVIITKELKVWMMAIYNCNRMNNRYSVPMPNFDFASPDLLKGKNKSW